MPGRVAHAVSLAFERLKQEDHEFEAKTSYIERHSHKKMEKRKGRRGEAGNERRERRLRKGRRERKRETREQNRKPSRISTKRQN